MKKQRLGLQMKELEFLDSFPIMGHGLGIIKKVMEAVEKFNSTRRNVRVVTEVKLGSIHVLVEKIHPSAFVGPHIMNEIREIINGD